MAKAEKPLQDLPDTAKGIKQAPGTGEKAEAPKTPKADPTRYGDWEKNGRCIDF